VRKIFKDRQRDELKRLHQQDLAQLMNSDEAMSPLLRKSRSANVLKNTHKKSEN
jgi:hypothetical protein